MIYNEECQMNNIKVIDTKNNKDKNKYVKSKVIASFSFEMQYQS